MRGKLAKVIRKAAYRGTPSKGKRVYSTAANGQVVVIGPRWDYQHLKDAIKKLKMKGATKHVRKNI